MARRRLSWLLAALLALQTGLAAAHCLRPLQAGANAAFQAGADAGFQAGADAGFQAGAAMEICTPEGMRWLLPDGQTQDPADHGHAGPHGFCPACHALPQLALPDGPVPPAPRWVLLAEAGSVPTAPALRPPVRGPPHGARGPPIPG
ncbi:hypothetical protein LPC08_07130 [Roseomonas sp. OT10]|uniref:DUF2946 family protein n=1 Tax=Roseomonas cutis TaxID=2897332 RepID=UPI001E61638B|nr:DUF2946 family protein [Roseomonas sp. OT10]UFN50383.1 hypothetical protein LPC08_07130 [Roseomonas sp. OT10]